MDPGPVSLRRLDGRHQVLVAADQSGVADGAVPGEDSRSVRISESTPFCWLLALRLPSLTLTSGSSAMDCCSTVWIRRLAPSYQYTRSSLLSAKMVRALSMNASISPSASRSKERRSSVPVTSSPAAAYT